MAWIEISKTLEAYTCRKQMSFKFVINHFGKSTGKILRKHYEFITFLSTLCPPEKQFVISLVFITQFRDPSDLLKLPGWFETHVRGSSWINLRDINYNQDENANFCSAAGKLWQVYRGKQLIKLYLSLCTR